MSSGQRAWPQLPLTLAFELLLTNKVYNVTLKHFI
jgi:hypothetical protein